MVSLPPQVCAPNGIFPRIPFLSWNAPRPVAAAPQWIQFYRKQVPLFTPHIAKAPPKSSSSCFVAQSSTATASATQFNIPDALTAASPASRSTWLAAALSVPSPSLPWWCRVASPNPLTHIYPPVLGQRAAGTNRLCACRSWEVPQTCRARWMRTPWPASRNTDLMFGRQ